MYVLKNKKIILLTLQALAIAYWAFFSWKITERFTGPLKTEYLIYTSFIIILSFSYLFFIFTNKNPLKLWHGYLIIAVSTIFVPFTLETDHLRYILDGMNTLRGVNPFAHAPDQLALYNKTIWAKNINHPHLSTIYPPAAQLFFYLSTYLNPFLWPHILNGVPIENLNITHTWQIYLGWKLLVGLCVGFTISLIKNERWDLLILNPLFLLKGLGNAHIDVIACCLIIILISLVIKEKSVFLIYLLTALAILTKWYPIIFIPFILLHCFKKYPIKSNVLAIISAGLIGAFITYQFVKGAEGNLLKSAFIYGENWYFFGFLHRFIADFLSLFIDFNEGIRISRYIVAVFGVALSTLILAFYSKEKLDLNQSIFLMSLALFLCSPTLHPWYLLLVLATGFRYFKTYKISWVWPILSAFSILHYYNDESSILRYVIYFIVVGIAALDFKNKHPQHEVN